MRTPAGRLGLPLLTFAFLLLCAACGGGGPEEEQAAPDTAAMATPAPESEAGAVSGGLAVSSSPAEAVITNPMPHAMIVSIEYASGGGAELGIVPAGGEQTFTLAAIGGDTVTLIARDEADTHSRDLTFVIEEGQPRSWTIQ
jgi:hypothetical protein